MDLQHDNSVSLRFERVIAYFLDGIPRPFLKIVSDVEYGVTFEFCSVGFPPDYTGLTETVQFPEFRESQSFDPICLCYSGPSTPSSRMGAHYSPYVGTFRFNGKGVYLQKKVSDLKRHAVRVPTETCERKGTMSSKFDRDLRTSLFIDFYERIAENHLAHERESLRRIVVLSTQGVSEEYSGVVEQIVYEIKRLYIRACGQFMYQYMNQNLLFRRIVSPLCLSEPENDCLAYNGKRKTDDFRFELALRFKSSISRLEESLPWSRRTHQFFAALQELWANRFGRLAIFDINPNHSRTNADAFLAHLGCSMRAAFTRIRIEFYTQLEMLLFTGFFGSMQFASLDSNTLSKSDLGRIFLAARVFLVNRIRTLIFEALKDLVHFFTAVGEGVISPSKARKIPLIDIHLTVGDSGFPCSPSFALLRFGLADLLDELFDSFNNLPIPEVIIMRTLDFERRTLNSFDAEELSLKGVLINYLDVTGSKIDELIREYACFSTLPPTNGAYFTRAKEAVIEDRVRLLRESILKITSTSPDFVFSGRIAINCTEVKKWYVEHWTRYLENYLTTIQSDILSYITATIERCRFYNAFLNKEPKTVEELEEISREIIDAESRSNEVKMKECNQVIGWFQCLETLQVSVDTQIYAAALDLMRCPNEMMQLVLKSKEICTKSKPSIIEKLGEFRNSIRIQVTTISDGVQELLGLFNLEVCDIAAQTCEELRAIVDKVSEGIEHISYCEQSLGIDQVDSFEDFFPIVRTFEVLEQFWGAVFDSTTVRDYYNIPISALNATQMIDHVQRCRRLLHFSTRSLRAYPGLVRLGRQQEQVLNDFECLEGILMCVTAPGLRKNHWKEISRILGKDFNTNLQMDSSITLQKLLESGIQDHFDELKQVVDPAVVDFETEASLERMKSEAKRTRFVFEVIEGTEEFFSLSPLCRDSISSQLETFLLDLRVLREHVSVSHYVINSINEWETAVEKMRCTLSNWNEIEYEWIEVMYFGMTLEAIGEGEIPAVESREWKFLREKVGSINGIFSILYASLQKTQYTLFTAMIQENIQEQLNLASTILGDIRKVVMGLLDAKREAFPRFYFLSDGELISFLSVLNTTKLTKLLSKMYSRVCDVGVEGNTVTTFIAADGAILKAEFPIQLSAVPVDRWMKSFERTLRSSLFHELRACIESHYYVDSMTWLRGSCVQIIDVALRVIHNRDLHEALSLAGSMGINAYAKRLRDLTEEHIRIAGAHMESGERRIVSSVIVILSYFRREIQMALKTGIQTKEDLDKTAILRTFMENDKIFVQTLGLRLPYGMEFLGNYTLPVLTSEDIEGGLYTVFVSFAASSFPIIIGSPERVSTLQYCAEYLGRFWWCLQCHPALTLEGIVRDLRGALAIGAVFCLKDIDVLEKPLILPFTNLFRSIEAACQTEKHLCDGGFDKIGFEINGTTQYVQRDPCFQIVLTATNTDKIPTGLSFAFRPIYIMPVDLTVVAQCALYKLGVCGWMTVGQRLALMYAQLIEVSPVIFTVKNLLTVISETIEFNKGTVAENLCTSFLNQFWQAVHTNERLQNLLEWNMLHTLGISQDFWDDALSHLKASSEYESILDRFTCFMKTNSNVVLLGPAYSGKTKLWKGWVGESHHVVISFRLMSCAEIYGDACHPGLLSSLAKQWDPLVNHVVVIEYANFLQTSIIFDTPAFVRIRPHSGADFIKGERVRLIAVASELNAANPRVMVDFAIFALPGPTRWKKFFKELLSTAPTYYAGVAYPVMVTLIDHILDTRQMPNRTSASCGNLFAVASRCSQLYKRWYVYAKSRCVSREEWISDQAFALQCAVFATTWSLGLHLHEKERHVLRAALEKSQLKLNRIAKEIGFTEDVLPSTEDDILRYIATPVGWKKMDKATAATSEAGFASMWSRKWDGVDINQRTWSQFFPFPSRETTLTALEYLIDAGQSVLITGENGQGKSTILRQMRSNEGWVHQLVCNSTACRAVEINEALLRNMTLRQSKIYGPSIGRKLVLSVDDVNLPGEGQFSQVMHLFSFIDRFSAILSPSLGYVPIADVVCAGASTPGPSYEVEVENAVVRVRLPEFEDSEIVGSLQKLFDVVCVKRRGVNVSKDIVTFLVAAHSLALRLIPTELRGEQANEDMTATLLGNNDRESVLQEYECSSISGFQMTHGVCISFMHHFLKVSDKALRFLSKSWDDAETATVIFNFVHAFYANMIEYEEKKEQFKEELKLSANTYLRNCFTPGPVRFETVKDEIEMEEDDGTDLLPCTSAKVQVWMRAYETALLSNVIEEPLNIDSRSNIVFSPLPPSQHRSAAGSPAGIMAPRLSQINYVSQWLSILISALHQYLRQPQTHVALIGRYDNGIRRALRVWGFSMRIHVACLRENYVGPDANEQFKNDLIHIIQHTCRNDGRLVVFVPNSVLGLAWPMGTLDAILRGGDATQLFTCEDLLFLLYGRRGMRRNFSGLTMAEYCELKQRICSRLSIVTHVLSYKELNHLRSTIPLISYMLPVSLRAPEMLSELVNGLMEAEEKNRQPMHEAVLRGGKLGPAALPMSPGSLNLAGHRLTHLLCDVFSVMKTELNLELEQLLEFCFETKRLCQFLERLRCDSAQSRHITQLPAAISAKMKVYKEDIDNKADSAKMAIQQQMKVLLDRLKRREKLLQRHESAATHFRQEAVKTEKLIMSEEETIQTKTGKVAIMLSTLGSRIAATRISQIKQFGNLLPSTKGVLLMKAVCKVIGEELPGGSLREVWDSGKSIITSPKFIPRLLAVSPSTIKYESLSELHTSLREVRYSELCPFAGSMAEYVGTLMEAARLGEIVRGKHERLSKIRLEHSYCLSKVDAFDLRASEVLKKLERDRAEVKQLLSRSEETDAVKNDSNRRQNALAFLSDIVDRFIPFHSSEETATRETLEKKGEGAVIMVAAHRAFFAMLPKEQQVLRFRQLQSRLNAWGIAAPEELDAAVVSLLFPSVNNVTNSALLSSCSDYELLCLGALLQRVYFHWPFFGGASPAFEGMLKHFLNIMCGGCTVTSALSKDFKESLLDAARTGDGLLICDASVTFVLHELRPLLLLQPTLREATMHQESARVTLYGETVEVKSTFYVVCVSSSILPYEKWGSITSRFMTVTNFHLTFDVKHCVQTTLLQSPITREDVGKKYFGDLSVEDGNPIDTFNEALHEASALLCEDLDTLTGPDNSKLLRLDVLIRDLSNCHGRVLRLKSNQENVMKQSQDAWKNLKQGIYSVESAIRVIEESILGRHWEPRKLEPFIIGAKDLLRAYQSRISPHTFDALPEAHKEFYATINFIERVIQVLGCGWPCEFRGIFAWYILSSAIIGCDLLLQLRGELYSPMTIVFNSEQYKALDRLLNRGNNVIVEEYVREVYAASSDSILKDVVRQFPVSSSSTLEFSGWGEEGIVSEREDAIRYFFLYWLGLDYASCDTLASHLYNAFLLSIKEQNNEGLSKMSTFYEYMGKSPSDIYCLEEWLRLSLSACIPLWVVSMNASQTVKHYERYFKSKHLSYQFCHVSTTEEVDQLMKTVSVCFFERPEQQGCGHFVVAMLSPPEDAFDEAVFVQYLSTHLSRYCRYGVWEPLRNGGRTHFPVLLCCVVCGFTGRESDSPNKTGKNSACVHMLEEWCLTLTHDTSFSRFYLFSVLQDQTIFPPWEREGMTLMLEGPALLHLGENKKGISRRTGNRTHSAFKIANIIELHTGLVSGQVMLRSLWAKGRSGVAFPSLWQVTVDRDDLTIILRLLALWLLKENITESESKKGRSLRLSGRPDSRGPVSDTFSCASPKAQQAFLENAFAKLAFGVYAARMTTRRFRLAVSEVLRQRAFLNKSEGGIREEARNFSMSIAIEEASKAGGSDKGFLAELRNSHEDFLELCEDESSAVAYRDLLDASLQKIIYGISESPTSERLKHSVSPDSCTSDPTAYAVDLNQAPSRDLIQLLFLWEKDHMEGLLSVLQEKGHNAVVSCVQAAMGQLSRWVPGETLTVWLPALQYPRLLLYAFAARAVSRKLDELNRVEMVLVMSRRYSLLHDDIILFGAAPSETLEQEVLSRTDWDGTHLSWKKDVEEEEHEEDIVLAVRFQKVSNTNTEGQSGDVLWEVSPGEKRVDVSSTRGARPGVVFLTETSTGSSHKTLEIRSTCPLPVLCASAAVTGNGREVEWPLLLDMPLHVIWRGTDNVLKRRRSSSSRRYLTLGEEDSLVRSTRRSMVDVPSSTLSNSLSFFVTIS
ncbi:hypothetical protein MOQ_008293 [Trypanosoma cruzi marinkellei]|uniref:Dynein heavy chain n=1 Tax=Trypanosoma cruzi marinkellei TaxID=85056 RepID=K2NG58_TRYCR|nr:hypothetical protein MOQ_008293 [Trypanosoma cruzi marinkellei]